MTELRDRPPDPPGRTPALDAHGRDTVPPGLVFTAGIRAAATAAALVTGVVVVSWSATLPSGRDPYVLAHAVGSAPFLCAALALTWCTARVCPPEHRTFWLCWLGAGITGVLATLAAFVAVVSHMAVFLLVDMAFLLAGVPLWVAAVVYMVRALAGRLSIAVDLVDAATVLLVLGTPGVLLLAGPMGEADASGFEVPFAVAAVVVPPVVYLSLVNLSRIPQGERVTQGLGIGLAAAFVANLTLQLAYVVGDLELPLALVVSVHVVQMVFVMCLPLWARRQATAPLPARSDVGRASPMPYVAAALLPPLAAYVLVRHDTRAWEVVFLTVVLLLLVVLNAARYTAITCETRRLHGDLAAMAAERRRLLAGMLRGLEADRHRTVAELHSQTVGSLAALGTVMQTARLARPADTATLAETVARLHRDLRDRAEELRQLMLAMRPRGGDEIGIEPPGEHVLGAAVRASAAELYGEQPAPPLSVVVDPSLELDWATTSIAYRIIQEALSNVARHARASTVAVRVAPHGDRTLVEVRDDGVGFRPPGAVPGSGLVTMELFAQLGQGELEVCSAPGEGTVVRATVGGHAPPTRPGPGPQPPGGARPRRLRHLHVVGEPEAPGGSEHSE